MMEKAFGALAHPARWQILSFLSHMHKGRVIVDREGQVYEEESGSRCCLLTEAASPFIKTVDHLYELEAAGLVKIGHKDEFLTCTLRPHTFKSLAHGLLAFTKNRIKMAAPEQHPVVIIGGGPVGLAAAAHLADKGASFLLLESGSTVASSVISWGHIQLFSPWQYCIDEAARRLLESTGWVSPEPDEYPTGQELADKYLLPLASTVEIAPHVRTEIKVVSVSRFGIDKMKNTDRERTPFLITFEMPDGREGTILARAVIDTSGTYTSPNPMGSGGVPAQGERRLASQILYRIPNANSEDGKRFAGKRTAVIGSGHSAFNTILELTSLARTSPNTEVIWVVRKRDLTNTYGGELGDALPERGALGSQVKRLVETGAVRLESGFKVVEVESSGLTMKLVSEDGRSIEVDEIVANTGFRPDLSMLSELRLNLHPAVESPVVLAEMIDPNFHSCGTVDPHGAVELQHPEKDFYIAGMKSYGRAPTFLMLTGYEQVRSIACELTGDLEGARKVELVLPETGVCSGDGCCTPPPTRKTLTALIPLASREALKEACCGSESNCC